MIRMENTKRLRLFIGIPLPEYLRGQLSAYSTYWKHGNVKIIPKSNYHITLLFLGYSDKILLPEISKIVQRSVMQTSPFVLKFDKVTFVPESRPHMIWVKFKENNEFSRLGLTITNKMQAIMPLKNRYTNIPHITLIRFKHKPDLDIPQLKISENIRVDKVYLYKSEQTLKGSVYTVLKSFLLQSTEI